MPPKSGSPTRPPAPSTSSAPASAAPLTPRKQGHIEACLDDTVDQRQDSFGRWKLRYCALPELALEEVTLESEFAGRFVAAPVILSAMTGGTGEPFRTINRNLALGAEALGLPLGVGSMRVMFREPEAAESFRLRELAPTVPLISNLGLASFNQDLPPDALERVIEVLRPDVFGLHLNALQEVVQEGGDTDFRGLFDTLAGLVRRSPLPVYVKECGGGIAPELVARLAELGVAYVDLSGSDGTSWAAVEARLSADPGFGERFRDFGLPTAWLLEHLPPATAAATGIVAGGGIRHGIQAVKALALGARYVSVARPFLAAAMESPEAVVAVGERLLREMRTALFLVGCRTPANLGRGQLIEPR